MSSIKVIFQKLPASELDFQAKLKNVSQSASAAAMDQLPLVLSELQQHEIRRAAIGPRHFAFLTEDGAVCRVGYSADAQMFDLKMKSEEGKTETPKNDSSSSSSAQQYSTFDVYLASRRAISARARGRGLISARSRPAGGASGGPGANRTVDESITVPEDRIVQCQAVLAGKSREIIKRELQKTNLDVNMAINNILSRDEGEEPPPVAPGGLMHPFQHSDELFSLIEESGGDPSRPNLLDDILSPYRRQNRLTMRHSSSRHRRGDGGFGSTRPPTDPDEPPIKLSRSSSSHGKDDASQEIHYDVIEWWPESSDDPDRTFVAIVALHEELIALDNHGRIHQWCWFDQLPFVSSSYPTTVFHPKTEELGLLNEVVTAISGAVVRASVITQSNKVATIADASIQPHEHLIEHSATHFPELGDLSQAQINTCSLWTVVVVRNEVYWWGIVPFEQRKRQIEMANKLNGKRQEEMTVGSAVCLKKQPIYRAGTRAVKLLDNQPKIGELTHDTTKYDDIQLEFKILHCDLLFHSDSPPPQPVNDETGLSVPTFLKVYFFEF